jgi:hypothetical protein
VLIDSGDYVGDVAVWTQSDLVLRAIDGPVRIIADNKSADEKGIWLVKGDNVTVDGIEFAGARVRDRNGAGIRHEGGNLFIRNCRFLDNENGILAGGNPDAEIEIEATEFGHNGAGDGQSHNLYVGSVARLTVSASYFHHARVGHLLKSRAKLTCVKYSRLTDERDGRASYELELPNGGFAVVIGNIIQQGPRTENFRIVSYGAEGLIWPDNAFVIAHNTLVNDFAGGGYFLHVRAKPKRLVAYNNLLVGKVDAPLEAAGPGMFAANFVGKRSEMAAPDRYDYRLKKNAYAVGRAEALPTVVGANLRIDSEYVHPRELRRLTRAACHPGAQQTLSS